MYINTHTQTHIYQYFLVFAQKANLGDLLHLSAGKPSGAREFPL